MPRKRSAVTKRVESVGVRQRLGRPVRDAETPLMMPLTRRDINQAEAKRRDYGVDDPENFRECVLATCVSKVAGCEVEIFRRHAYVALPDDDYTLRYEVAPSCWEIIHLNDQRRFDEIPRNALLELRPPSPSCRLVAMRANAHRKDHYRESHGTGRKQRNVDPHRGVYRNGVFAID